MPDIKTYAPYEAPFLPFNIAAYMLFPKDEDLRESYMAQKLAEYTLFCADEDQIESVPIENLKGLIKNSNHANLDIREKIVLSGSTAGHILLNLIKLDASGEEASVNKAIYLGAEYFANAENTAGGEIASSNERHIRRAWSAHKSVAHFWAALQVQIQTNTKPTGIDSTNLYLRLLSLAKELSKSAVTLTNKNVNGPIFKPDELWSIPDSIQLPTCQFKCQGLERNDREMLKYYKAMSVKKH